MRRANRFHEIVDSMVSVSTIPITAKIRTGISESKNTAHSLLTKMKSWGLAMTTVCIVTRFPAVPCGDDNLGIVIVYHARCVSVLYRIKLSQKISELSQSLSQLFGSTIIGVTAAFSIQQATDVCVSGIEELVYVQCSACGVFM